MYQYTSRQILLPSGGESAWRYKETRGVISQGRRDASLVPDQAVLRARPARLQLQFGSLLQVQEDREE